jgi:pimeloyl-ACP methyl ester carboxylesterase
MAVMRTTQRQEFLHHIDHGSGPPIFLIHGISQAMTDWYELIPVLNSAGYRTIAVDLFGHGDSPKPNDPEHYTIRTVYGTLEVWLDSLRIDPPYYLVGHSLGGYMSLNFARRHPDRIRAMVLINPLYSLAQLSGLLGMFMPYGGIGVRVLRMTPQWVVNTFLERSNSFTTMLPPKARMMYARNVKRASPYFLLIPQSAEDLTPDLGRITPKTMVIYGVHDNIEDPLSFPRLVSGLPNAIGRAMTGCGHQPHHNKPDVVNQMILDFFNRNPDGRVR